MNIELLLSWSSDREFNISYYTTLFENGEVNRADVKIPTYLPESQEDFDNRLIFENRVGMHHRDLSEILSFQISTILSSF